MVNLLIAGDFCPNDRVARLIEQEEYSDILGEIKPIIAQMGLFIDKFGMSYSRMSN